MASSTSSTTGQLPAPPPPRHPPSPLPSASPSTTATATPTPTNTTAPLSPASSPSAPATRTTNTSNTSNTTATTTTTTTAAHASEARRALVASISNLLDTELAPRAQALHAGAAAISSQERDVARATAGLRQEREKLARAAAEAGKGVKMLGDVQYWAEVLESDFLVLEETVRIVRGEDGGSGREECGSRCGSGSCCSCSEWSGSEVGDEERDHQRGEPSGGSQGTELGEATGAGAGAGAGDKNADISAMAKLLGSLGFGSFAKTSTPSGAPEPVVSGPPHNPDAETNRESASSGKVDKGKQPEVLPPEKEQREMVRDNLETIPGPSTSSYVSFPDTWQDRQGTDPPNDANGSISTKQSETTPLSTTL